MKRSRIKGLGTGIEGLGYRDYGHRVRGLSVWGLGYRD